MSINFSSILNNVQALLQTFFSMWITFKLFYVTSVANMEGKKNNFLRLVKFNRRTFTIYTIILLVFFGNLSCISLNCAKTSLPEYSRGGYRSSLLTLNYLHFLIETLNYLSNSCNLVSNSHRWSLFIAARTCFIPFCGPSKV